MLVSAQMGAKSRESFSLSILCLFFLCISINAPLSVAGDAISPGQSLSRNQTIVSKEGNFELGFFNPGNSTNYYIGIWFRKISVQTVIWVANREIPVLNPSSSELKITENGNLVLLDQSKIPIWSSNVTSHTPNSSVAVLLDTGNLVLRDHLNSSTLIWQSFDHPTDTWVPGSWIGMNKITGEFQTLTSWKNSEDPGQGLYSLSMDPGGSTQIFVQWNGSETYWSTGYWNGRIYSSIPELTQNSIFNFSVVDNKQRKYAIGFLKDDSLITRAVMDLSGQFKLWIWKNTSQDWLLFWSQPLDQCEVYNLCGIFGICDQKSFPICWCLQGFKPASPRDWDLTDWSSGCARKTPLQCNNSRPVNGEKDEFLVMPNTKLPVNSQPLAVGSAKQCKLACLSDCNCTAYAFGSGCSIWNGNLQNIEHVFDGDAMAGTLYLRLAVSEIPSSSNKNKMVTKAIVGVVVGFLMVLCIFIGLAWRYQRRRSSRISKAVEGSLILFTYTDLQRLTKNFSEKLGSGSFGCVFKGVLPDSTAVAVKKLVGHRQGEKEFRAEVSTLGTIQHVNLVRLRGFCSNGAQKLLVYDYMPNGSLGSHLFPSDCQILDWTTRYRIILGISRGVAYLHEKCRQCIIHCDIKPENILLDMDFCPKVADFGMAKLLGRDFSRVLTTMRGTLGYLAPEWISGMAITPKVDVYSFGMVLFEIISGRRNIEKSEDRKNPYFPVWASIKINEGDFLALLDKKLDGNADMEELCRACRVANWCIQDAEAHRPSMVKVVQMLEGIIEVSLPPIPRCLQLLAEDKDNAV